MNRDSIRLSAPIPPFFPPSFSLSFQQGLLSSRMNQALCLEMGLLMKLMSSIQEE